jgi:two-component system, OmpR family, phosphate regulon response regulator PhoB
MAQRIAVVEDEADILEALRLALKREGYEVDAYPDGAEALLGFRQRVPDLVLLDWMLPGMSGLDLCRVLRSDSRFSRCAVIMLTARGSEMDVVTGLGQGSDDYIVKPFKTREVIARIKAVLRRYQVDAAPTSLRRVGQLWLEPATYRAGDDSGAFDLTPMEFKLLEMLLRHPGRVYSRGQILSTLWPDDRAVEDRAVDVHIARLRDKMGRSARQVETVRGLGYRLKDAP